MKDQISVKSQELKHDELRNDQESQDTNEHVAETHEAKINVEKVPEPEPDRKNGHKKDIEVKLETVNEEVSPEK